MSRTVTLPGRRQYHLPGGDGYAPPAGPAAAGLHSARRAVHLGDLMAPGDTAGLLPDVEPAAARARAFFTVAGVPR